MEINTATTSSGKTLLLRLNMKPGWQIRFDSNSLKLSHRQTKTSAIVILNRGYCCNEFNFGGRSSKIAPARWGRTMNQSARNLLLLLFFLVPLLAASDEQQRAHKL